MLRHKENLNEGKIKLVSFISFLLSFSQAILSYVLALYFARLTGSENVGPFYLAASILSLVIFLNAHRLIRAFGRSRVLLFSVFAKVGIVFGLVLFGSSLYWGIGLMILNLFLEGVSWIFLDIILESFSVDSRSGRIRGLHLMFLNLGYLAGPFLSTWLLGAYDFVGIFNVMLFIDAVTFAVVLMGLSQLPKGMLRKISVKSILKKVRRRADVARICYIAFVLEVFYVLMVLFIPLRLLDLGYTLSEMGFMFTIMLVPFVLFPYPLGYIADRKTGEKEFMLLSLFLMSIATAAVFFMGKANLLLWTLALLGTRLGPAMLEIMRDSYFYKRVDERDIDLIGVFRGTRPLGGIVGTFLASILLLFFPLQAVFLMISFVVASAIPWALAIEDNPCEERATVPCSLDSANEEM